MKSIYTSILLSLFYLAVNAETWQVSVVNFSFNPSTINAVVGDVIQFNWGSGNHTTTCGSALPETSLPAGATPWDSPMNFGTTTFSYTVTVAGTYFYGCTPHFDGGSGMAGTINVSGTLPVTLGQVTVNNKNNAALIEWNTFTESNTAYFSVRKSIDGIHFKEIGKVNAAGNSGTRLYYTFTDTDLGRKYKYLYYEIVTVDIDKKESASPIKTLRNNNINKENLIVALSPNPITRPGELKLQFNADGNGEMDVSVFNMGGQRILVTKMAAFYGLNSGHLHVCDLKKGTYNIVFQLAGKKEIKKVIIL